MGYQRHQYAICTGHAVQCAPILCNIMSVLAGLWQFGAVGSDVGQINEVTLRLTRLVLGWVGNLSQFNQPLRSTQPGHPFVGRRNEYRSKGGDALRLGSKGRYGVVCRLHRVIHI